MRKIIYLLTIAGLSLLAQGCSKSDDIYECEQERGREQTEAKGEIPEGYFEVVFSPADTRAAVSGLDGRIQDLRYILFKSTGEFVKERRIVTPANGIQSWPLQAIRDTLPKGNYQAVLVGNTEKTLFPYATSGSPVNYSDVLVGYRNGYSSGRIVLPNAEFNNNTEFYMANVTFSNTSPNPYILLQRIIGMMDLHRNFVDAQTALNHLVANIVANVHNGNVVGYHDIIQAQVTAILPGLVRNALQGIAGLALVLDSVVNATVAALIGPVTDALYQILLQDLVNEIGLALTGNADQNGLLRYLGVLLNPWADSQANTAVVTINNFAKSINFDRQVQEYFTGLHKFKCKFTGGSIYDEKDILIRGFGSEFDIREINVVKQGILAGLIFDQIVDGPYLLNGTFIDIKDPIKYTVPTNKKYKSDYSFIDLGLKSYDFPTQGARSLTLTVKLGDIPNLDGILGGVPILTPVLGLILAPLRVVTVSVPVNLPVLSVENLTLSGGWQLPPTEELQ